MSSITFLYIFNKCDIYIIQYYHRTGNNIFIFGGIWRYLAVFGGIWRYLAVFDGIWRYLAVFGGIWRYWAVLGGIGRYWAVYAVPTVITRLKKGDISCRFFSLLLANFNNSKPREENFPYFLGVL